MCARLFKKSIPLEMIPVFGTTVYLIAPKYWQAAFNHNNWHEASSFPCV